MYYAIILDYEQKNSFHLPICKSVWAIIRNFDETRFKKKYKRNLFRNKFSILFISDIFIDGQVINRHRPKMHDSHFNFNYIKSLKPVLDGISFYSPQYLRCIIYRRSSLCGLILRIVLWIHLNLVACLPVHLGAWLSNACPCIFMFNL